MNRVIVIAAVTDIVEYHNPVLLHTHGSPVVLGKKWADYFGKDGFGEAKGY